MNSEAASLNWQWPDNRQPQTRVALKVTSVEAESRGFLGIKRSPSLARSFPEPVVVTGIALKGDAAGTVFRLRLPKKEVPDVNSGDRIGIGIVDGDTCICVRKVPAGIADANLAEWLERFDCI